MNLEMINSVWRVVGPLMLAAAAVACARVIRGIFADVIDDLRGKSNIFTTDPPSPRLCRAGPRTVVLASVKGGREMLCRCKEEKGTHRVEGMVRFNYAPLDDGGHTAFELLVCKECHGFCGFPPKP